MLGHKVNEELILWCPNVLVCHKVSNDDSQVPQSIQSLEISSGRVNAIWLSLKRGNELIGVNLWTTLNPGLARSKQFEVVISAQPSLLSWYN